ncbi:MAG: FAD-dependent oxidoreductase [Intrasporangiaceae bacterium]|nr:FAD-dependent oxidoreductase [Intrasporangiaceae bacterium]
MGTVAPTPQLSPVERADVVVVGAGPGGAAAAANLAARGHDVVLFEKDRFPRDKVCGDAGRAGAQPRPARSSTRPSPDTPPPAGRIWSRASQ